MNLTSLLVDRADTENQILTGIEDQYVFLFTGISIIPPLPESKTSKESMTNVTTCNKHIWHLKRHRLPGSLHSSSEVFRQCSVPLASSHAQQLALRVFSALIAWRSWRFTQMSSGIAKIRRAGLRLEEISEREAPGKLPVCFWIE